MSWLFASGDHNTGASLQHQSFQWVFRVDLLDWFNLLAVQRTLRSLLQHHSSKASILLCSAFFTVQFSQPYLTTGKTITLTIWTFVSSVMSLLLNTSSRFVISFPAKKQLSSDFMATVTIRSNFRAQEKKICHCFHILPFFCHEAMGTDAMILVLLML